MSTVVTQLEEYHHTCNDVPVTLLNEIRVGHTNVMTKEHWEELYK